MSTTRTGARLHTETRVIKRGLAQMTDDDYVIKRCAGGCGARINPDSHRRYCRNGCVSVANSRRFRDLAKRVKAADGQWIDYKFDTPWDVNQFLINMAGHAHMQASRKSALVVSVRWVVA